jgi:hypothetical protein
MLQDNAGPSTECAWITDGVYKVKGCGCDPTDYDVELQLGESLPDRYGPAQDYLPPYQPGVPCDAPYTTPRYVVVDSVPCLRDCDGSGSQSYLCADATPGIPFQHWELLDWVKCPDGCYDPTQVPGYESGYSGFCKELGQVQSFPFNCFRPRADDTPVIAVAP